ncbi:MAG: glycosyltransferase family 39 protein [Nevskiales bacterium]
MAPQPRSHVWYIGAPAILALILLLAAALRLAGVHWGLPDSAHPDYSYHPDEALTILWARWLAHGTFIAKQFIYGGTLYYSMLNAYFYYGKLLSPVLGGMGPMADTILVGRYFVVLFSLLTIVLVYQTGKRLFDATTGLLAAAFLAIAPAHVFLAQNVRPDEFGTLLVVLLLYLSALILRGQAASDRRNFAVTGFALGVAIALRFPLAALGIGPVLAWLLREQAATMGARMKALLWWRIPLLAAASCIGYAIASPHTLTHFDWLLQGLQVQKSYQTAVFADAVDRGPGFYQYGWLMLREALGTPLYCLTFCGLALACIQRTAGRILVLVPTVAYFLPLTIISWVVVRYTLPLVPLLSLLGADFVVTIAKRSSRYRHAAYLVVAGAVFWTLLADTAFLRVEAGENVRDVATDWIRGQIPRGATIIEVQGYVDDVYLNPVIPEGYRRIPYVLGRGAAAQLLAANPDHDYLVLSGGLYRNMDRLGARNPQQGAYALQQVLESGRYRLVAELVEPVHLFGIDFSDRFASQDYQIINPGERIYRFEPGQVAAPPRD